MAEAIQEHEVRTFVADITARTAPGNELLARLGLNSIPAVVAWGPGTDGQAAPLIAHETYTAGMIVEFIRRADSDSGDSARAGG